MSANLTINITVHRVRWIKEQAEGGRCASCSEQIFGHQFRPVILVQFGKSQPREEIVDSQFCAACRDLGKP